MYNVKTNIIAAATAIAVSLASCQGKSEEAIAAGQLADKAQSLIENGKPTEAIAILDSLMSKYPTEVEAGRRALALRPRAIELGTIAEIQTTDSLIAVYSAENEQIAPSMKKIDDKDLVEPYYVASSGYDPSFMNSTGIQPRVDEIGQFYILSSVTGNNIRHNSITIKSTNGEVSTQAVPYDGDSNYRIDATELVTYSPEACDTIGYFVARNPEATYTLIFNGENGKSLTRKLTSAQAKGIADAWTYSRSIVKARDLAARKQMLEQRLQIARDQIARTSGE